MVQNLSVPSQRVEPLQRKFDAQKWEADELSVPSQRVEPLQLPFLVTLFRLHVSFQYPPSGSNLCNKIACSGDRAPLPPFSTLPAGRTSATPARASLVVSSAQLSVPSQRVEPLQQPEPRAARR